MKSRDIEAQRKKLLGLVHVGKAALAMSDESYRDMVSRLGNGKTSSKQMSLLELRSVVDEMRAKGFKPKASEKSKRPRPAKNKVALMSKVEALLKDAGRPWEYAHGMALKMFKVEKVDWLDADQLWRLTSALAIDAKRHGRGK